MKVIIIGGGASGMLAGITASKSASEVILIEQNEKLGKKIYITGKGRCNLSNFCEVNEFLPNVVNNPKFLLSALYKFSPKDTYNFFEKNGLKLKVERGNRVFPESDKASDVTKTLEKLLLSYGVDIRLNTKVIDLIIENGTCKGVITDKGEILADKTIICTGGVSYPATGSTGDGYAFAKKCGHKIINPKPSLCGIELFGNDFLEAQGLSLKNVQINLILNDKILYTDFGEMLFTHFGISGPIVLSASAMLNKYLGEKISVLIDLKPALTEETIDKRLLNEFSIDGNKNISSIIRGFVPSSLVVIIAKQAKIPLTKKCAEITKIERQNLIKTLKNITFSFKKLRPIEEAIVTSGGVDVKEVNPKTMESKLCKGLFFAGEVLNVDCFTGGYNLQTAFSTGFLAGEKN